MLRKNPVAAALYIWTAVLVIVATYIDTEYGEAHSQEIKSDEQVLEEYVDWFHRNMQTKYATKAKELIPATLKYCEQYNIDPLLMAVIYSKESSWRNFKGDMGEIGPGHVMPNKWTGRCDLKTLDGQIECAVDRMRFAFNKCPSLERALSHYASGSCRARTPKTARLVKRRVKLYQAAIIKFRGKQ
jgi:hypothetical protein